MKKKTLEDAFAEMDYNDRHPVCPDCDGEGTFETVSDCCDAKRDPDLGLCYECHDHCEPMECSNCNGTGRL
jgi:hypothetical protein